MSGDRNGTFAARFAEGGGLTQEEVASRPGLKARVISAPVPDRPFHGGTFASVPSSIVQAMDFGEMIRYAMRRDQTPRLTS